LLYGDWNAFEGQFFSEWRPSVHVRDLPIAPGIAHFASMDWGFNAFGCVLWWAQLPDGRYHVRWEYKFKGESAERVATEIQRINSQLGVKLRYLVCDPAMKQKTGAGRGESIFETLMRKKLPMRAGDNDRFNGWNRVHELLRLDEQNQPWITVSPDCKYLVRTLPAMVQDDHDPEDIDTAKDDHAVDALRYGAMSRPSPTRKDTRPKPYPVGSWGHHVETYHRPKPEGVLAR
jgi:hypothetical protein